VPIDALATGTSPQFRALYYIRVRLSFGTTTLRLDNGKITETLESNWDHLGILLCPLQGKV
jgi:hypothetical protein